MRIPDLDYDFDDELSLKNFANFNWKESGISFKGKAIYGSAFYSEAPDADIFPEGTEGVVFVNCNIDNLVVPPKSEVVFTDDRIPQSFQVQNDLNDWIVDAETKEPIKLVDDKIYTKLGLKAPTPADIPTEKVEEKVDWMEAAKQEVKLSEEMALPVDTRGDL